MVQLDMKSTPARMKAEASLSGPYAAVEEVEAQAVLALHELVLALAAGPS